MKVLLGGAACVLLLALVPAASAGASPPERAHTFTGYCYYHGYLQFRDPVGVLPEPNELVFDVKGPCTGLLDGRPVQNATARFRDRAAGVMSCTQGLQLNGPGRMTIEHESIGFLFTELRFGPVSKFSFTGTDGGTMEGIGSTDDDMLFLIDRCLAGDGSLRRVSVYAHIAGSISG